MTSQTAPRNASNARDGMPDEFAHACYGENGRPTRAGCPSFGPQTFNGAGCNIVFGDFSGTQYNEAIVKSNIRTLHYQTGSGPGRGHWNPAQERRGRSFHARSTSDRYRGTGRHDRSSRSPRVPYPTTAGYDRADFRTRSYDQRVPPHGHWRRQGQRSTRPEAHADIPFRDFVTQNAPAASFRLPPNNTPPQPVARHDTSEALGDKFPGNSYYGPEQRDRPYPTGIWGHPYSEISSNEVPRPRVSAHPRQHAVRA